jgi:hypothetical protein
VVVFYISRTVGFVCACFGLPAVATIKLSRKNFAFAMPIRKAMCYIARMDNTSQYHWHQSAGRKGGQSRSQKKLEALRSNVQKATQARMEKAKYFNTSSCTCGAGASLSHRVSCRYYKLLAYRKAKGLEIIWH